VDVRRAAGVVAREGGFEGCHAVGVCLLDAAEEGRVEVGFVVGVAVAVCYDAGVDAGAVAVPDLDVDVRDGLAGVDVDDLVVEGDVDAGFVVGDVLSDEFASNIWTSQFDSSAKEVALTVRTLGDLRSQDAGSIATEQLRSIGVLGVSRVRLVVGCRQDLLEVPPRHATASTCLLNSCRATSDAASLDAASTKALGTVGEVLSVNGVDEVTTLGDLFRDVVSGVSVNGAEQSGQSHEA
jgi:hypothetical protein